MLTIVLVDPKIPQNTGNIGRLCAANNVRLHLVGDIAFDLSDKYLKRAGLDYWPFLEFELFPDLDAYFSDIETAPKHLLTTKSTRSYLDRRYSNEDYLIFGSETEGLSDTLRTRFEVDCCTIPMANPNVRSLNLANSVGIVMYGAIAQQACSGH